MFKVFFLIFEPRVAWDRIVRARRGFVFILGWYVLPMILLPAAAEGWSMERWGKWQPKFQRFMDFSLHDILVFETIQAVLLLAMVLLAALMLLIFSQTFETFQKRRHYLDAFTTVAYSYSPLLLLRLLDASPAVSPWVSWGIGITLAVWVFYQGIPQVMQPDPTHAFGLYLAGMFVMVLSSTLARVPTALYLLGEVNFHHSWLTHKFPGPFQ
jgi:hypothetical protein